MQYNVSNNISNSQKMLWLHAPCCTCTHARTLTCQQMVSKSRLATPARALGVAEAELEDDVSRLQFDAEMVVEHEHEIEVEAQATEKPVFGNSDADRRAGQWPLLSLLVPPSFNKSSPSSMQIGQVASPSTTASPTSPSASRPT